MRVSLVAASVAIALSLLLCWSTVDAQSYVPQPTPFTQCPPGQQLITLGSMDITNTTLFPDNDGSSILYGDDYYPYVYVTPFTLRGQNAFGVVIQQMAVRLFDMRLLAARSCQDPTGPLPVPGGREEHGAVRPRRHGRTDG